jgi:hypothetical protein
MSYLRLAFPAICSGIICATSWIIYLTHGDTLQLTLALLVTSLFVLAVFASGQSIYLERQLRDLRQRRDALEQARRSQP